MGIVKYDYDGFEIQFDEVNGQLMANATKMCSVFSKRPVKWLELDSTKRYLSALEAKSENRTLPLIETRKGGDQSGTWIHEKLILKLAQWLDVKFELWCDERIAELLRTGRVELKPMSMEEMMITQLQAQIQAKKDIAEIRQEVKELAAKVTTSPTDYFTIAGYASLHGIKIDVREAATRGREASRICKDNGWSTGSIPDPRFGTVKTYPKDALELAFK